MAEHLANEREMICLEPVVRTFQRVKPHLPTLSPSQYNHYKSPNQPTAGAIVRKTGKSWSQILESIGLPQPLDRDTLSRLSQSLHLLEKKLVRALGIGWQETAFLVAGHHKLRPDSFYLERAYLQSRQLLILDVKLSACSAPLTIYKYLPIFEAPPVPSQATFFPTWIPEEKEKAEPGIRIDERGQIGLFAENNVLYICYLVGVPPKDLLPGSKISCGRVSALKKKKLPPDMEVRFLKFTELPEMYCRTAGIPFSREATESILQVAERIRQVVLTLPPDAPQISREIYREVASEEW